MVFTQKGHLGKKGHLGTLVKLKQSTLCLSPKILLSSDTIKQLADRGVQAEMNAEGDIVSLRFSGSSYDDSAIAQLAKLRDLSSVDISDTSITPAGAARLRELLPTVTVIH